MLHRVQYTRAMDELYSLLDEAADEAAAVDADEAAAEAEATGAPAPASADEEEFMMSDNALLDEIFDMTNRAIENVTVYRWFKIRSCTQFIMENFAHGEMIDTGIHKFYIIRVDTPESFVVAYRESRHKFIHLKTIAQDNFIKWFESHFGDAVPICESFRYEHRDVVVKRAFYLQSVDYFLVPSACAGHADCAPIHCIRLNANHILTLPDKASLILPVANFVAHVKSAQVGGLQIGELRIVHNPGEFIGCECSAGIKIYTPAEELVVVLCDLIGLIVVKRPPPVGFGARCFELLAEARALVGSICISSARAERALKELANSMADDGVEMNPPELIEQLKLAIAPNPPAPDLAG